jgi:ABC-type dipeptide/oligopeptide/nickel transport system ATPase component
MGIPVDRDMTVDKQPSTHLFAVLRPKTDHLAVIAEIADRSQVMYTGRIVEQCARTAILEDPQDRGTCGVAHD